MFKHILNRHLKNKGCPNLKKEPLPSLAGARVSYLLNSMFAFQKILLFFHRLDQSCEASK